MPTAKPLTFDFIRQLARELPGVREETYYGTPALKLGKQMLACIPAHKSAEPDSLVISIDFDSRAALLAEAPEIFYIRDYYKNHPVVLVRLSRIAPGAMRDLLRGAWRFAGGKS